MAKENKTQPTKLSASQFVNGIEHDGRRADAKALLKIFKRVTGKQAVMWGDSMVGFGQYHYHYDSGREGEAMMTGFSPRKSHLAVYLMDGFSDKKNLLATLGKYKTGSSCLYINKLADVDEDVLCKLISRSYIHIQKKYS